MYIIYARINIPTLFYKDQVHRVWLQRRQRTHRTRATCTHTFFCLDPFSVWHFLENRFNKEISVVWGQRCGFVHSASFGGTPGRRGLRLRRGVPPGWQQHLDPDSCGVTWGVQVYLQRWQHCTSDSVWSESGRLQQQRGRSVQPRGQSLLCRGR